MIKVAGEEVGNCQNPYKDLAVWVADSAGGYLWDSNLVISTPTSGASIVAVTPTTDGGFTVVGHNNLYSPNNENAYIAHFKPASTPIQSKTTKLANVSGSTIVVRSSKVLVMGGVMPKTVTLLTLSGRTVLVAQHTNTLSLAGLPSGMYLCRVETAAGISSARVIINH